MRLQKPRVAPLADAEMSAEVQEIVTPLARNGGVFNIFRTLAHHPALMRRWLVFGNHILGKSTLPVREREIAILRIGYLCRSGYEFNQHVAIGKQGGLSDAEIEMIKTGPAAVGWNDQDRALLAATDELHRDAFVSDATWADLAKYFNTQQLMDIVFTVGQYNLVSMALNTLGVQLDPGLPNHRI